MTKSCLKDDDPVLYEKVKDHTLDMPEDWEGEFPLYCKKCGKEAVMDDHMLWMCPELYDIPSKYTHPC